MDLTTRLRELYALCRLTTSRFPTVRSRHVLRSPPGTRVPRSLFARQLTYAEPSQEMRLVAGAPSGGRAPGDRVAS